MLLSGIHPEHQKSTAMLDAHSLAFFANFPDFVPDTTSAPITEFSRLAAHRHWAVNSPTWRRHWLSLFRRPYNPALDSSFPPPARTWILPQYDTFRPNVFFEQYRQVGFQPNYHTTIGREFARLAEYMGWKKGTEEWRERRSECFLREFERWWEESDEERLEAWQRLCREVGINPVPESIRKCKVVSTVWSCLGNPGTLFVASASGRSDLGGL